MTQTLDRNEVKEIYGLLDALAEEQVSQGKQIKALAEEQAAQGFRIGLT